jgi:hypothetical protein
MFGMSDEDRLYLYRISTRSGEDDSGLVLTKSMTEQDADDVRAMMLKLFPKSKVELVPEESHRTDERS